MFKNIALNKNIIKKVVLLKNKLFQGYIRAIFMPLHAFCNALYTIQTPKFILGKKISKCEQNR